MAIDRIGDGFALRTKGDIITHDGSATSVINVGTNGQILTAQSSTGTGLQWVDGPVTPTEYYIPIASATTGGASKIITFSGISGDYEDLILFFGLSAPGAASSSVSTKVTFNSNTTAANYQYVFSGVSRLATNTPTLQNTTGDDVLEFPTPGGSNNAQSVHTTHGNLRIYSYSSTSHHKTYSANTMHLRPVNNNISTNLRIYNGIFESTSAITSITFTLIDATYNFSESSQIYLYGIKRS
jgi:hypothetical protein